MKNLCFTALLCFAIICSVQGQVHTFNSPLTQFWLANNYTDFEYIDRVLSIEPQTITLATVTPTGKLIEVYTILELKEGIDDIRFLCTNRANTAPVTVIIPHQEKIEIIDLYRPSLTTGETEQIRLWID